MAAASRRQTPPGLSYAARGDQLPLPHEGGCPQSPERVSQVPPPSPPGRAPREERRDDARGHLFTAFVTCGR